MAQERLILEQISTEAIQAELSRRLTPPPDDPPKVRQECGFCDQQAVRICSHGEVLCDKCLQSCMTGECPGRFCSLHAESSNRRCKICKKPPWRAHADGWVCEPCPAADLDGEMGSNITTLQQISDSCWRYLTMDMMPVNEGRLQGPGPGETDPGLRCGAYCPHRKQCKFRTMHRPPHHYGCSECQSLECTDEDCAECRLLQQGYDEVQGEPLSSSSLHPAVLQINAISTSHHNKMGAKGKGKGKEEEKEKRARPPKKVRD